MNVFEIKNLKKSFDSLEVLKDISLAVKEGEVVSILGPSGSGKSTLLRCATMLETVTSGEMIYCGEKAVSMENNHPVYASKTDLKRIKSYFGLVFQNFNLFPHYSVEKNLIDAPIHVHRHNKEDVKERASELLENMGLSDRKDYYPCQLSGGQQQRVAIARALVMNPKIMFFDEPTSALDPELTADILRILSDLAKNKNTMVIVTHEIEFAKQVSDRIIFMDGGVIVEEGTPSEVIDNPKHERTRAFLNKLSK